MTLNAKHSDLIKWFQLTFPQLVKDMKNADHHYDEENLNPYHIEGDVWTHTNMVFKNSEIFSTGNDYVKWSTLLHDIGKPIAREVLDDRKKVRFLGHEGISSFLSVDVLNATDMSIDDKLQIFKLVALHGDLFHHIMTDGKIKNDVLKVFVGNKTLLNHLTHQVRCDSLGRYYESKDMSDGLFTTNLPEHFKPFIDQLDDGIGSEKKGNQLTVLCGPPCVTKSTWVKNNVTDEIVISRDNLIESAGTKRGMNYKEAYRFLSDNPDIEKSEVSELMNAAIINARKNGNDVVIDLTNMSKKSRRRWVNEFPKYNKKCITFVSGFEKIKECNKKRYELTGKYISDGVVIDMLKRFSLPMYGEGFDELEFIWVEI